MPNGSFGVKRRRSGILGPRQLHPRKRTFLRVYEYAAWSDRRAVCERELVRKPVPIPDQARDMLTRDHAHAFALRKCSSSRGMISTKLQGR
jgi:hypothetical protein